MSWSQDFQMFYESQFLQEHQHPMNIALHVLGTVGSAVYLVWVLTHTFWCAAILYPLVHGIPGLLGHRIFERDATVGDLRINRKDFPLWWFIIANHRLCWELFKGTLARNRRI